MFRSSPVWVGMAPLRLLVRRLSSVTPVSNPTWVGREPMRLLKLRLSPMTTLLLLQETPCQILPLVHGSPLIQLVLVFQLAPSVAK